MTKMLCPWLLLFSASLFAQKIGINTIKPEVALDVNGGLAIRSDSIPALNSSITTINTTDRSYIKFTRDNSPGSRLVNLSPGKPGQLLTLEYFPPGTVLMVNGSGLSNGGKLLMSEDLTFNSPTLVSFICSGKDWKELYRNLNIRSNSAITTTSYTNPNTYSFIIPPGIMSVQVQVWGPGGWGAGGTLKAGNGGFVSGTLNTIEGETLTIVVGAGSGAGTNPQLTAVKRGDTYLAVAASGGNSSRNGGAGGNGGINGNNGSIGTSSIVSNVGGAGGGASIANGGNGGAAGASGLAGGNGGPLAGGTVSNNSNFKGEGWGGNGWFGGGASGTYDNLFLSNGPHAAGGGGGGSNYTGGLAGNIISNSNGSVGGVGNATGLNGQVKITW